MQGGGVYMTEIAFGTDVHDEVWIQLPQCKTKQGVVTNGRKGHCDLVYDSTDTLVYDWVDKLQEHCQSLIFEKREDWFHNPLSLDDIESAFVSVTKLYKSGKSFLVRVNVKNIGTDRAPLAFDQNKAVIALDEIPSERTIIPMIKVSCIKFSSRSFALELLLQQVMILEDRPPIRECRIELKVPTSEVQLSLEPNKEEETVKEEPIQKEITAVPDESEIDAKTEEEITEGSNTIVEPESVPELTITNSEESVVEANVEREKQEIEEITEVPIEANDDLVEVEELPIEDANDKDELRLRKPNEVYLQVYLAAKAKAKMAKRAAVQALLEAKKIKNTYLLDDVDSSSDDELSETLGVVDA
tara:strand:+ start:424 stop:1497 length:1074 start_codon:yes stop_codon:yes gene_type:complete